MVLVPFLRTAQADLLLKDAITEMRRLEALLAARGRVADFAPFYNPGVVPNEQDLKPLEEHIEGLQSLLLASEEALRAAKAAQERFREVLAAAGGNTPVSYTAGVPQAVLLEAERACAEVEAAEQFDVHVSTEFGTSALDDKLRRNRRALEEAAAAIVEAAPEGQQGPLSALLRELRARGEAEREQALPASLCFDKRGFKDVLSAISLEFKQGALHTAAAGELLQWASEGFATNLFAVASQLSEEGSEGILPSEITRASDLTAANLSVISMIAIAEDGIAAETSACLQQYGVATDDQLRRLARRAGVEGRVAKEAYGAVRDALGQMLALVWGHALALMAHERGMTVQRLQAQEALKMAGLPGVVGLAAQADDIF